MSHVSIHDVVCPKCKKEQKIERYDSINDYHSEMFSKIVDKTIFDYKCKNCGEIIRDPYPILFHKMSIGDIQIGYKTTPIRIPIINPLMEAVKMSIGAKDISEEYNDIDEFSKRVADFI